MITKKSLFIILFFLALAGIFIFHPERNFSDIAYAVDNPVKIVGDNLLVCQAAGCPSVSFGTTDGNAYVSQRVGIGKTNPGFALDVSGTVNATALYVGGSPYIGSQWTTVNTTEIYYAAGNVGVGTTDPVKELDVVGSLALHPSGTGADTAYFGSLMITKPTASGQYINLVRYGTSGWSIGTVYNNSNFAIGGITTPDSGFTAPPFVIDTTGEVGIGTTNPTYKLHVVGTLYAGGSSRDFKENITPLALDPSKIYQLNPVTYDYKTAYKDFGKNLAGGRQFGLIAEDVAKIYPELAVTLNGKVSNVDYEKLSVLLLAEMKNQKTEIDSLKQMADSLEQTLIQLESKLR